MTDFAAALAGGAARIETALATHLALAHVPDRLADAMRHAVLNGGKRFRPVLLLETARLLGGADDGALCAACALELIHCYSLVHDDLPAMDNDDMRRGKPTVHKAYDEATAILVGDALQTLAFEILSHEATHPDGTVRSACVLALARAAGAMASGQMLDLAAEGRFSASHQPLSETDIRKLQAMKTGALIEVAARLGCLLADADSGTTQNLTRYGAIVGLAFQIADDLIDLNVDAKTAGKATGKDAALGKGTLPSLHGEKWARAELERLVSEAHMLLEPFGVRAEPLRQAARFVAFRLS